MSQADELTELGVETLDTGVDGIRFRITSWRDGDGVHVQLTTDRGDIDRETELFDHVERVGA